MRDQECKYSRESDWYPRMIKSFLLLQRSKTKVFSKALEIQKYSTINLPVPASNKFPKQP